MRKPKSKPQSTQTTKQPVNAIHIGASEAAVQAAKAAIVEILKLTECGDPPKVAAMETLKTLCAVTNVSISDCHFEVKA